MVVLLLGCSVLIVLGIMIIVFVIWLFVSLF